MQCNGLNMYTMRLDLCAQVLDKIDEFVHLDFLLTADVAHAFLEIASNAKDVTLLLRVLRISLRYQVELSTAAAGTLRCCVQLGAIHGCDNHLSYAPFASHSQHKVLTLCHVVVVHAMISSDLCGARISDTQAGPRTQAARQRILNVFK